MRIPLPPPPAAALISNGYPRPSAACCAAAASAGRSSTAGTTGTPAALTSARARVLSPMAAMVSGVGPMNVRPASPTALAKAAFSARKP
jgi:hypothetical protein